MATSPTQAQESKTAEVRFQFHHGSIAADIKPRSVSYPSVRRAHHSHSVSYLIRLMLSCHTDYRKFSFSPNNPIKDWNNLTEDVAAAPTIDNFPFIQVF